jgi:hypothetical protein
MQEGLLHTELAKPELTHSFAIWHMKPGSALADYSLMQHALTIRVQIWVVLMHHVLQKKAQQQQSG